MQNMDVKRMAIEALRRKIRKMEMEDEGMGCEDCGESGDLNGEEKGFNNTQEDAREMAEVDAASNGEDGEKAVSIEMEVEGGDGGSMEELYNRMKAEFGSEPESRKATGKKVSRMGGMGGMDSAMSEMPRRKGRR